MKLQLSALALALLLAPLAFAADAPAPVTLKGTLQCGKCALAETPECCNVLTVKTGDKTVNYYLAENDISKAAHPDVCMAAKDAVTVTGTVTEKDGKKTLTATKVEMPK